MKIDLEIQRAIADGQRNQEAKELIHNWCRHARIEKHGGKGLIEAQTGLPIGHHSMACDFAGGSSMFHYFLDDAALQFHDTNCLGCSKREPVALPNIAKLLERREREKQLTTERDDEAQRKRNDALKVRTQVRTALRATVSTPVATFIDDLQAFDEHRDDRDPAQRLIESMRLAPELLVPDLEEHLFSLLEAGEKWFVMTGLQILAAHARDQVRLTRCAMDCLAKGLAIDEAADVVADRINLIDAMTVSNAVNGLAYAASPPRPEFPHDDAPKTRPEPLFRVANAFRDEVASGFDVLLAQRDAWRVRVAVRALGLLIGQDQWWASRFVRSLAAELSRADFLVDIERDSQLRKLAHDLDEALSNAFVQNPEWVDSELMRQFESASEDGEGRIASVYYQVFRNADGGRNARRNSPIKNFEPYKIALRRLVFFSEASKNSEVTQHVLSALRHPDEALASVAKDLMDLLLGAAAVLDTKLQSPAVDSAIVVAPSWLEQLERSNQRSTLWYLRSAFVALAVQGALHDADGLVAFETFLAKRGALGDSFTATLIRETGPLMATSAGLRAILPHLYAAMVSPSTQGRAAAAKAIEEMGNDRFSELPPLVSEAFLLMLLDPYVIVHKAAVAALRSISLHASMRRKVSAALQQLIVVYRHEPDQEFLLECVEAKVRLHRNDPAFVTTEGRVLLAVLGGIPSEYVLRSGHYYFLKQLAEVDGFAQLALGLLLNRHSEYEIEHALDSVDDIPVGTMGLHSDAILRAIQAQPRNPEVAGTFVELLTRDGVWSAAAQVARIRAEAIPDTTRERVKKLFAQQLLWRIEFEDLLAQGRPEEALEVGKAWQAAEQEINDIHERQARTDPFRSLHRSTASDSGATGAIEK